jgi:hypothetical protein
MARRRTTYYTQADLQVMALRMAGEAQRKTLEAKFAEGYRVTNINTTPVPLRNQTVYGVEFVTVWINNADDRPGVVLPHNGKFERCRKYDYPWAPRKGVGSY